MDKRGNIALGEWMLLGLTGLFLCLLLGLFLHDRAALAIPAAAETERSAPIEAVRPDPAPLNLNTASEEALTALPGIGEELARRIAAYREANGPFAAVEEVREDCGIGRG